MSYLVVFVFLRLLNSMYCTEMNDTSLDRLWSAEESSECPTLCDDIRIDAITPINFSPEMLLVSGKCAWILDLAKPDGKHAVGRGFLHNFSFSQIQDMIAIGNKTNIEFVNVYASGLLIEVFRANQTGFETDFIGSNVFPELSVDLELPIDAAFAWTDYNIVYLIQGSKYWAYEMSRGWKMGGKRLESFPRNITDFGLQPNAKISTAFADTTKIYFVTLDLVYAFEVKAIDSLTGIIDGSLLKTSVKLKDFLKCPKHEKSFLDSVWDMCSNTVDELDFETKIACVVFGFFASITFMTLLVLCFGRHSQYKSVPFSSRKNLQI